MEAPMVRLILLGTGSPRPRPHRFGSACLVALEETALLFDCGPGTTIQLARAGFSPAQVRCLFFTHHHFDHNADYGYFALSHWQEGAGRVPPLRVYGPRATAHITNCLFSAQGAFADDIAARMNVAGSMHIYRRKGGLLPRKPLEIEVTELGAGSEVAGDGWKVTAAEAIHAQPYLESLAYRLETPERAIVFSGDTAPCDSLTRLAAGAHTLVYCAHDPEAAIQGTPLAQFTSGPVSAARIAQEAGVHTLVLTHIGDSLDRPEVQERELAQARRVFPGPIILGQDLMEV